MAGIKRIAREAKRSTNAKTVWAIDKPVYGIPGSGLAFQNKVEASMKKVGLLASQVVPGIFYGRERDSEDGNIRDWIIDFRYFCTDKAVAKFEKDLDKEMKLDTLSDDATND